MKGRGRAAYGLENEVWPEGPIISLREGMDLKIEGGGEGGRLLSLEGVLGGQVDLGEGVRNKTS